MSSNPSFREDLLEWGLNIGSPVRYTSFYISFHTADPGETGANEAGLARTSHDAWKTDIADDGIVANTGTGETAGETNGVGNTYTHFGVFDSVTTGVFLFGGSLSQTQALLLGEKLSWADAALKASIT